MINRKCLVHQIILNKDNSPLTIINNITYVLIKVSNYHNNNIYLKDINYIQNMTYNIQYDNLLLRDDWVKLWCDKVDYYEYQINQLGKEYPLLCDSLNYFIGLGENAISYIVNNVTNNVSNNRFLVVSHKRIKKENGSFDFYNPLNFVIDNRARDVAEYIKNTFFDNIFNIDELRMYLNYSNFTKDEYIHLYSRLLFPSYYFDIYDEIINTKSDENKIIKVINSIDKYQDFLSNIYKYIVYEKKVQIEPIEWVMTNYS